MKPKNAQYWIRLGQFGSQSLSQGQQRPITPSGGTIPAGRGGSLPLPTAEQLQQFVMRQTGPSVPSLRGAGGGLDQGTLSVLTRLLRGG
jgi:hypothetical protein